MDSSSSEESAIAAANLRLGGGNASSSMSQSDPRLGFTKRNPREFPWLLPGEKVDVREQNMGYLSPVGKIMGTVTVTNYRLHFKSKSKDQTASGKTVKECEIFVPLGAISKVEKIGHSNVSRGEDAYGLEIICKDMRNVKFSSRQENHSRRPLFECLQKLAFPVTNGEALFAMQYQEKFSVPTGWEVYNPHREFKRMGISETNDMWTVTRINQNYSFADTYPSVLCVPAAALRSEAVDEDFLQRVGTFRSKARIPVLSWLNCETQASLTRCAQPMVGLTARRSQEDEAYLQMIIDANAQSSKLWIMDARPEVNAKVNKAKGGGYESSEAYKNCELVFLDIQNIHVMRQSLQKLMNICYPRIDDKTWLLSLDESHWLEHIKLVLVGASRVVDKIENHKTSVLVHCSDGWDRTAQLTSLSMIMLDSFYRTLIGFQVLVEKEWCSFGHKFAHRIGHGEDKHSDSERSPIFLQFVDAVWQLTQQFPTSFEFNSHFLITVLDELYGCRFGTFLFNTEQNRFKERLKDTTHSVWSMVNSNADSYLNPYYNEETKNHILIPCCSLRRIKLWNEYYLRYNETVGMQDQSEDMMQVMRDLLQRKKVLEEQVRRLKEEQQTHGLRRSTPRTAQPPPTTTSPPSPRIL